MKTALTEAKIKNLQLPTTDTLIGLGNHLFLRHRPSGRKTFVLRRKEAGKMTSTTIGDWPQWTIQRARASAQQPAVPLAERITFGEAADRFCVEMIEARYRGKPAETVAFFTRDSASLYPTQLSKVTRQQLIAIIMKKHATAPNNARKMLAILKQFCKWAVLHDLLANDPLSVATVGNLGMKQYEPRARILTTEELRHVLTAEGRFYPLMRFVLATGVRIGEALQMVPEQVTGDTWTIPVTKNGKPHSLHLTGIAKAQQWTQASYEVVWEWAKKEGFDWNFHDLRRTAATLMRQAGVSIEHVESVLNHSQGKLIQTYQRHDPLPAIRAALLVLEKELVRLSSI
jgi:integrase